MDLVESSAGAEADKVLEFLSDPKKQSRKINLGTFFVIFQEIVLV